MGGDFYYCWGFYVFIVVFTAITTLKYKLNNRSFIVFALLYAIFFLLLSSSAYITPDYIAYADIYVDLQGIDFPYVHRHMEVPYVYLANQVSSYFYFRILFYFIVSCALFLFIIKCKSSQEVLLAFTIFSLYTAIAGRQIIASLSFFIGFYYLFNKKKVFLGVLLVVLSIFLHKAAVLSVIVLLIIPFISINKRCVFTYLVMIPVFVLFGKIAILYISDNLILFPGSTYFFENDNVDEGSIWWVIISFVRKTIVFGIILSELSILYRKYSQFELYYKILYKYLALTFYVAVVIFFIDSSGVVFDRCMGMMDFPMLIMLPFVFNFYKFKIRKNLILLISCMIYFVFTNIYIFGVSNSRA